MIKYRTLKHARKRRRRRRRRKKKRAFLFPSTVFPKR
jgi:hypothetical protein